MGSESKRQWTCRNAKKVLTFLLSVLTSDWLKQQKLTKLHKAYVVVCYCTDPGLQLRDPAPLNGWSLCNCWYFVFSGFGIWPSIRCGIRENANYIDGKRDLTATREAVFTEIRARSCKIFLSVCRTEFGGKSYVLAANANNQTGESSVVSPSISFTSSFLPLFLSLRRHTEALKDVAMALKTRLNSKYQSKESIYLLLF